MPFDPSMSTQSVQTHFQHTTSGVVPLADPGVDGEIHPLASTQQVPQSVHHLLKGS